MRRILFLATFLVYAYASAAPIPATSSSQLLNFKSGFFLSNHGFQIHAENTNWQAKKSQKASVLIEYRSPKSINGVRPALSVRVDSHSSKTLKNYMRSALQDYVRFGFKALTQKPLKINGQKAFLVDLYSPSSSRKLRQVVYFEKLNAAILTCRSHKDSFNRVVKDCNEIIKNFKWLNPESNTKKR